MAEFWENDPIAQGAASASAADWWKNDPVAETPEIGTDVAKGASYGFNTGLDAMLNTIGAPIRAPANYIANQIGYEGELIPELQAARRFNVAGGGETTAGRTAEAIGEVAGGSVLPGGAMLKAGQAAGPAARGILGQYARNPGAATSVDALSTLGAGSGVALARENDLGPVGEIGLGLVGGLAVPNAANVAARTYGGVRSGVNYANRQVRRARDPVNAAYQDVADQSVEAGLDLPAVRDRVAPQPSANLRSRNTPAGAPFAPDDMAEIVSRRLSGEPAANIAADYGLHPTTVQRYVDNYQVNNPTPRNLIDIAREDLGAGGSAPLSNQARADMAIADDPVAMERLITRQRQQPGRTAQIIEQTTIDGRNFDDEIERLSGVARQEERAAYAAARQNAQPVNLRGVIRRWRGRRPQQGGEINDSVNRAVDMFFTGGMAPTAGGNLRYRRVQDLVDDVPTFLERRRELDQMIARSMQDGRPTPLTRELTQFRTDINNAARRNNPDLQAADARFAENRTTERILTGGADIGKRLTPRTRRALRDFRDMTPTQQELQRLAFERQMMDDALNTRQGRAAADQFNTESFQQIINNMYPRSAGREIHQRGQDLLRNLRREAISTDTTRGILSGSRTAPLQDDIAELMEGPRAAADLATGRFGKVLENLSNRLTRQIGQRAAQERIRIVTETDPAQMLPMLSRLAREAQTAGERQAYAAAIRQFAAVGRRPAVEIGTITTGSGPEDRNRLLQ